MIGISVSRRPTRIAPTCHIPNTIQNFSISFFNILESIAPLYIAYANTSKDSPMDIISTSYKFNKNHSFQPYSVNLPLYLSYTLIHHNLRFRNAKMYTLCNIFFHYSPKSNKLSKLYPSYFQSIITFQNLCYNTLQIPFERSTNDGKEERAYKNSSCKLF